MTIARLSTHYNKNMKYIHMGHGTMYIVMCQNSDIADHSYLVSLFFAAPIPTLVIFMKFLPCYVISEHVDLTIRKLLSRTLPPPQLT